MDRQRFLLVCIALCMSAGLWGLYWIPQRMLEELGMTGGWGIIAQYLVSILLLAPFAIRRYLRGENTGLELPLIGLLMGGGIVCYANSFLLTDVIRTMLLFYLTPFWATLIEVVIQRRLPGWWRLISLPLALAGVSIVLGNAEGGGLAMPSNTGDWLALGGGAIYAAGAARVSFSRITGIFPILFAFFVYGGLMALVQAWVLSEHLGPPPTTASWLTLLPWLALLSVFFFIPTNAIISWSPSQMSAGLFSILILSEIIFGTISAALWANELFGWREVVGSTFILLAGELEVVLAPRQNTTDAA